MKIEIENLPVQTTPEILKELSNIINDLMQNKIKIKSKNFFIYKGGSHYAIHQIINFKTLPERIILITF